MALLPRQAVDVLVITIGRSTGHLFLFASTIYCARILAPESFGVAGIFASIVSMASQVTGLRGEAVALSSRGSRTSSAYIGIAYLFNTYFLAAGMVVVFLYFALNQGNEYAVMTLFVPLAAFLSSINQFVLPAQLALSGKQRLYGRVAGITSVSTAIFQVVGAWFWPTASSLALARTAGPMGGLATIVPYLRVGFISAWNIRRRLRRRILRPVLHELAYQAPAAMLSTLAFQIPTYIFGIMGQAEATGSYWLSFNLMFLPYLIVASSFRPIYVRLVVARLPGQAAADYVVRSTKYAALLGVVVAVLVAIGSSLAVTHLLGGQWGEASGFASVLSVMLAGLIVQTPITAAVSALKLQRLNLFYNMVHVVVRLVAFSVTYLLTESALLAVAAFAVSALVVCVGYLPFSLSAIVKRAEERVS